jgi:hypothetical protein
MSKRVLAFDIGIKNLAWCCGDLSGGITSVRGWANENLITGESGETSQKCVTCKCKAVYGTFCVRHCPPATPALRDLSGNLLKKIPSLTVLKGLAQGKGAGKSELKSKTTVLTFLEKHYSFPKVSAKVKKIELEDIHDGIRKVVLANRDLFKSCSEILLENQPVLKNPVMKSVQMMLFATLRDVLTEDGEGCPKVRLVHAKKKTVGVETEKGDAGYADRKNASEARILQGIEKKTILVYSHTQDWFSKQTKKSDLADCLSMVMDSA